jgi:hypothetical protein
MERQKKKKHYNASSFNVSISLLRIACTSSTTYVFFTGEKETNKHCKFLGLLLVLLVKEISVSVLHPSWRERVRLVCYFFFFFFFFFFYLEELCISLLLGHVHLSVEDKNHVSLGAAWLENTILSRLFPLWSCKTCFFAVSHKYYHFL